MTRPLEHLAAIDLGTNSCRLVVVAVDPGTGHFRVLEKARERVRLGSGPSGMRSLSGPAMRRALAALRRFARVARRWDAPVRAVATSAVREASNRGAFIRRVLARTGIRLEVASGPEEARLIYLGALQSLPVFDKRVLLVDIGGGSAEFLAARRRRIRYAHSLKLGAIRLTERFFPKGRTDPASVRECRAYVAGLLAPVARELRRQPRDLAIGTAGTVCSLARMIKLGRGDASPLNGTVFTRRELETAVAGILEARTPKRRAALPGLGSDRADIIVAGALALRGIFEALGLRRMTVSEYALREGLVLDTLEKRRRRRFGRIEDVRRRSVLDLAGRCGYDRVHAHRVARLALRIFDQTRRLHGLGDRERGLLESAGLLHDIGTFVSRDQHHRHAYYLIRHADLLGYPEEEKEILANLARYHRKSHPKPGHEGFLRLDRGDRRLVRRLAGILRIAEALDRSHRGVVRDVVCRSRGKGLRLVLRTARGRKAALEFWGAEQKKGLFEEAFGKRLRFGVLGS